MATGKKVSREQTRTKILNNAFKVLVGVGYERATLAEIANQAGVHMQTLIRHFPTKADIMAGIHIRTLGLFEQFFHQRECSALTAWRQWIQLAAENSPEILVFPNDSYRFPVMTPQGQDAIHQMKVLLAEGIAEDMGVNPAVDLRPTLIACMLMAGNAHIAQAWRGKRFKRKEFVASLLEVVDESEAMLEAQLQPGKRTKQRVS